MSAKISDVARAAGVSTATVSHVINKTRFVSADTTQKVTEAIQALGYVPNASARTLKTGKTNMIGFIVPDISNLFFATIIQQVEAVLGLRDNNLIIVNTKETPAKEQAHLRNLTSGITDGIIIASAAQSYGEIREYIPEQFPCVFFDRELKDNNEHDSVLISSYQAMHDAVNALVGRGHRRIGYIAGLDGISTTRDRLEAFLHAMEQNGLPVEDELIRHGDSVTRQTIAAVDELLAKKCTAIITSNNLMSVQTSYRLSTLGVRIGQDLDLLVYRDYDFYNSFLADCDTIVQPVLEFGNIIGESILARIDNPGGPVKERVLNSVFQPKT
ncbi:LacI family transcriptional regulator [Ruminococcaceae bacterium OttesenSCG-928-D13]|nr:LacI family transcriptional regulator [Ruminococcaceae bacterium OttesenSCG-928-D13]